MHNAMFLLVDETISLFILAWFKEMFIEMARLNEKVDRLTTMVASAGAVPGETRREPFRRMTSAKEIIDYMSRLTTDLDERNKAVSLYNMYYKLYLFIMCISLSLFSYRYYQFSAVMFLLPPVSEICFCYWPNRRFGALLIRMAREAKKVSRILGSARCS